MKKTRIVLGYFLGFILSIMVTLLVLALIIKFTVSDKNYVLKVMEDNNYYNLVSNEIMEEMKDTITSSGFDDLILKDLYDENDVKEDILLFMDNVYDGKKTKLNKEEIKNKLEENIEAFLKKNNVDVVNKDDILPFENDIKEIYENEVTLYNMADSVINIFSKIKYINKIIIGLIVGIILLVVLLIILHQINFLGSSIIASSLIILFMYIGIYQNIDVDNLLIITENFSKVLISIIRNLGSLFLMISISLGIIGLIILLTLSCKANKN